MASAAVIRSLKAGQLGQTVCVRPEKSMHAIGGIGSPNYLSGIINRLRPCCSRRPIKIPGPSCRLCLSKGKHEYQSHVDAQIHLQFAPEN